MALEWEKIDGSHVDGEWTERVKIPGGWLVRWAHAFTAYDNDQGSEKIVAGAGGMTFVPDVAHEWDGKSLA